jgi:NAD(P)-dependent dehydrogenase (short-subunit alcohol dehydrogenase family)
MTLLNLDLTGRSALVTAATAGIGSVVAEGLARQNAEVWINGRSQQRVDSAVERTLERVAGANVKGVAGDVSTAEGVEAVISVLPEVDVLVNTAGVTRRVGPFIELTDAEWQLNWDLNVMSGVRLSSTR